MNHNSSSNKLHFEHFILQHLKVISALYSTKSTPTRLIIYIRLRRKVIRIGEISITFVISIAFIRDKKVMTTSKCWTIIWMAVNCVLRWCECHFLLEVHLQQERFQRVVRSPIIISSFIPFERGVACDGSAEFSADEGESVLTVVACLLERCCTENVLWGPIKQLEGFELANLF